MIELCDFEKTKHVMVDNYNLMAIIHTCGVFCSIVNQFVYLENKKLLHKILNLLLFFLMFLSLFYAHHHETDITIGFLL